MLYFFYTTPLRFSIHHYYFWKRIINSLFYTMYTAQQYYNVKRENDALKYHYNQLVDVMNEAYSEKVHSEKAPSEFISCRCAAPKQDSSNIVEMLKTQNALLNRELINKNKQIGFLKTAKYEYLTSPRSVSSTQVDQLSEISEFSCCGRS